MPHNGDEEQKNLFFKEPHRSLKRRHNRKKTHLEPYKLLKVIDIIHEESPEPNEESTSNKKALRARRKSAFSSKSFPESLQILLNEGNFERTFRNIEKLKKNIFTC